MHQPIHLPMYRIIHLSFCLPMYPSIYISVGICVYLSIYLPVHKHRKTHTHTQTLNIHALSEIRIHDPGFRASEDSECLRPLGYRDRPIRPIWPRNLRVRVWRTLGDKLKDFKCAYFTLDRNRCTAFVINIHAYQSCKTASSEGCPHIWNLT
jgi:hypothetical protein